MLGINTIIFDLGSVLIDWNPKYVFDENYNLRSLYDLDSYIKQNNHLPGIPSASEVKLAGGVELGNMNVKLLEKIEELTLYLISLKKENDEIKKQIIELQNKSLK